MWEVPVSSSRCNHKLAHSNGNLAIPKQAEEIKSQASFNSDIPVNAGIRGTITLSNSAWTEDENGDSNPEAYKEGNCNKHKHRHKYSLALLLSEDSSCSNHHDSYFYFPYAAYQHNERYACNHKGHNRYKFHHGYILNGADYHDIYFALCAEQGNNSECDDGCEVENNCSDDQASATCSDEKQKQKW